MNPQVLVFVMIGAVVAWSLYRRIRRHFGRQPVQPHRMTVRVLILAAVIALVVAGAVRSLPALEAALGGLLAGAAVGALGLRLTSFEWRSDGSFYTPNGYLGAVLSVVLIARLAFRFAQLPSMAGPNVEPGAPPPVMTSYLSSPLTVALVLMLLAYYLVYIGGIVVLSRRHTPTTTTPPPKT
ncbi:MAG TPA: hypothetical protein VLW26_04800 [Steroidobacteraceae bacterium]|nr:hypothetical protein [Steroidobacteraceae bacterium]